MPSITRFRRVGLLTYGSGAWNQCTIHLALKPEPNAADRIMAAVDALHPAGRTPLTEAVAQAADALDFRHKPGVIVILTDGEETCGGAPCDLSEKLHAEADQLTIHVIGLRVKNYTWIGEQGILDAKCLAEKNGGAIPAGGHLGRAPPGPGKDPRLPDGHRRPGRPYGNWGFRQYPSWRPVSRPRHKRCDGGEQALQVLRARLAMLGILDQGELDIAALQQVDQRQRVTPAARPRPACLAGCAPDSRDRTGR